MTDSRHSADRADAPGVDDVVQIVSSEAAIAHAILSVVGEILDPIADVVAVETVPGAADAISELGENVADLVADMASDLTVHLLMNVMVDIILAREDLDAIVGPGRGDLQPTLSDLEIFAATPGARELFATRMLEATKDGEALLLPSGRELAKLRDHYLDEYIRRNRV